MLKDSWKQLAGEYCREINVVLDWIEVDDSGYAIRVSCELGWRSWSDYRYRAFTGKGAYRFNQADADSMRRQIVNWSNKETIFPPGHPGFTETA